jgi:TolB-like protein/DNA-binding winged helix-turn-helix (wHTH) protein/tetratricopeptide (TPR) repeat protein
VPVGIIQFEEFALDCDRYELLRAGQAIKLEKLPMELLILLVEKSGHLVTRQQIIERLWGADVFLDTEHGINTAVRKLRTVLGDNPEQSRFIQTVTGKGYRFVALTSVVSSDEANDNSHQAAVSTVAVAVGRAAAPDAIFHAESPVPISTSAHRRHTPLWVAAFCLVIGIATLWIWRFRSSHHRPPGENPAHRIRSLAVLPLENLSGDSGQDYFAEGMTDELITMLAKQPGLRVVSRTSSMQYKNAASPLPEIARQLGVDGILEGSIGRSGNRVHVNVQLVHAPSDTHLWAESYDRDLSDVGALESDLATTIARQVGTTVSASPTPQRRIRPEAHDAYLWGRYEWFGVNSEKSGEFFQKAIDLQPDYAAAWSGLADSLSLQAVDGDVLPEKIATRAEAAARRALELDDQLGDAHKSIAAIHLFLRWDFRQADRESARAVELEPGDSEAHHLRSYVLEVLDRKDEALQEQKKATELDPLLRPWSMGALLIRLHQFDAAVDELRSRAEAQPNRPMLRYTLWSAYRLKGMDKESAEQWEKLMTLNGDQAQAETARRVFAKRGMKALNEWRLQQAKTEVSKHYVSPYILSFSYARLRMKEETLHCLEQAFQERAPSMVFLQDEPDFDFLHSEPRYQAVVSKMGLPSVQ